MENKSHVPNHLPDDVSRDFKGFYPLVICYIAGKLPIEIWLICPAKRWWIFPVRKERPSSNLIFKWWILKLGKSTNFQLGHGFHSYVKLQEDARGYIKDFEMSIQMETEEMVHHDMWLAKNVNWGVRQGSQMVPVTISLSELDNRFSLKVRWWWSPQPTGSLYHYLLRLPHPNPQVKPLWVSPI